MKDYRDVAESVFKKSEIILEEKAKKIHRIRNISLTTSGMCAAAIVAVTVLNNNDFKSKISKGQIANMTSNSIVEDQMSTAPDSTGIINPTVSEDATATFTTENVETATESRLQGQKPFLTPSDSHDSAADEKDVPQAQDEIMPTSSVVTNFSNNNLVDDTNTSVEWDKLPIQLKYEKFDIIEGDNNDPLVTTFYTCDSTVPENKVRSHLVSGNFHAENPNTGKTEEHGASVYMIQNIDRYDQLAVRFDGDDNYYLYENTDKKSAYEGITIENMIDDFRLREKMIVESEAIIHDNNLHTANGIEAPFVWQILTTDAKLPNIITEVDDIEINVEFKVHVSPSLLEYVIGVSKDGYVYTNIVPGGAVFEIGKERATEIIDNVVEN